jgi:hypothetical protein
MPRTGAVFLEHEAVVAAAVIAAQATGSDGNFRQRDVRFFIELFSNWMQSTTLSWSLEIHNAQVLRHLNVAVSAGWARRVGRTPPQYRLTPEGLLELLGRLGTRKNLTRLDEFFLVFHFFDAYASRLVALVERSGPLASRSLAVSVHELLDKKALVARERAMVARELERLAIRSEESREIAGIARERLGRGEALSAVIGVIQREFPYELNSQKPLHALFAAFPEPWQRAELVDAAARRADGFWAPTRALLLAYDGILASLPVGS